MSTNYVVADVVTKSGQYVKNHLLFLNKKAMEGQFRILADRLKLTDAERVELFDAVKRWVVCDYGLAANRENKEERGCLIS